jgi:glutamyl-tRNA synthetase
VTVRTRFAPSPTGDLHLGGAWTALASWVLARQAGGAFVLRVEDLDAPRVVAGSEASIVEDLRWLGLDWDEGPIRQSGRAGNYEEAIARLAAQGLTYPCDCSRAEIARVASAPHPGEEVVYPGLCRELDPAREMKRSPALRVCAPDETIVYEDSAAGTVRQNLAREIGDFVLRRGDGVFAYQLAVIVDDLDMGITEVLRGADLVASTPRQIWLAMSLGAPPPRYTHLPLVVAPDGSRLEKRTRGASVRELRQRGVSPERIVGHLAHGLGLAPTSAPATPREIVEQLGVAGRSPKGASVAGLGSLFRWPREPWRIPTM